MERGEREGSERRGREGWERVDNKIEESYRERGRVGEKRVCVCACVCVCVCVCVYDRERERERESIDKLPVAK